MLTWSAFFLIVAIVAGFYSYGGKSKLTCQLGKGIFFIFLTLCIISVIYSFLPEPNTKLKTEITRSEY